MEDVPYRPLGLIKTTLENLGFEVSHCYDDLIFVNHNAFLLRMEEEGQNVSLLFNTESTPEIRGDISNTLAEAGKLANLNITRRGTYKIVADEENATLDIHFSEEPSSE